MQLKIFTWNSQFLNVRQKQIKTRIRMRISITHSSCCRVFTDINITYQRILQSRYANPHCSAGDRVGSEQFHHVNNTVQLNHCQKIRGHENQSKFF